MPGPIVTRAQWGARFPDGDGPGRNPATELWLHHSVTTSPGRNATLAQDVASVVQLEKIGQTRFGCGISYTFAVTASARIFEGHTVTRQGTHTYGHNTVGRAIVLIGDYDLTPPNDDQVDAVRWLIAQGYARHWWTIQRLTGGHRDVKQTECPGTGAYHAIPLMNIPWPMAPPPPPPPPPPVPPAPRLGDQLMSELDVTYYDANWQPDPLGRSFRAAYPVEVGTQSVVVARGWVRWTAHWGTATFSVMAWDINGQALAIPVRGTDYAEIPPTARKITVEGTRTDPGVKVAVAVLMQAK